MLGTDINMKPSDIRRNGHNGLTEDWNKLVNTVQDPHQNADSWKVLASLCARRLRKRALTTEDPVCIFH
jgi:hypothetical protein